MPGQVITNNSLTSPVWAQSELHHERLLPGGSSLVLASFYAQDSVFITTTAQANANATSISVKALSGPIPAGTIVDFSSNGTKLAKLTSAAAAGATSITVGALPAQINSGSTARYYGDGTKKKVVLSGTLVGRTHAERIAGTGFGPADANDDEFGLVAFEKSDLARDNDFELVMARTGFVIYENKLPEWASLNAGNDEIQTITIAGTLSGGVVNYRNPVTKDAAQVAYSANLATIQTALDAIYGSGVVVASGTIAATTLTFSDAAGTGLNFPPIDVDVSNCTGATSVDVGTTTEGGNPLLDKLRANFICTRAVS